MSFEILTDVTMNTICLPGCDGQVIWYPLIDVSDKHAASIFRLK
jgi:hypothetical protein